MLQQEQRLLSDACLWSRALEGAFNSKLRCHCHCLTRLTSDVGAQSTNCQLLFINKFLTRSWSGQSQSLSCEANAKTLVWKLQQHWTDYCNISDMLGTLLAQARQERITRCTASWKKQPKLNTTNGTNHGSGSKVIWENLRNWLWTQASGWFSPGMHHQSLYLQDIAQWQFHVALTTQASYAR